MFKKYIKVKLPIFIMEAKLQPVDELVRKEEKKANEHLKAIEKYNNHNLEQIKLIIEEKFNDIMVKFKQLEVNINQTLKKQGDLKNEKFNDIVETIEKVVLKVIEKVNKNIAVDLHSHEFKEILDRCLKEMQKSFRDNHFAYHLSKLTKQEYVQIFYNVKYYCKYIYAIHRTYMKKIINQYKKHKKYKSKKIKHFNSFYIRKEKMIIMYYKEREIETNYKEKIKEEFNKIKSNTYFQFKKRDVSKSAGGFFLFTLIAGVFVFIFGWIIKKIFFSKKNAKITNLSAASSQAT